jgi:SAM-dependent methyltransferase
MRGSGEAAPEDRGIYGAALAKLHHERFGALAAAATGELVARLARAGVAGGRVIDLGAGSGILAGGLIAAGYEAWGVDASSHMLDIARREAPRGAFVQASLWDVELPPCVAVAAVGEVFSYAADPRAGRAALATRLSEIERQLQPEGLLLFDVAGPGRSGPSGERRGFWSFGDAAIGLVEREDRTGSRLVRDVSVFMREGDLFRRSDETHALVLYDAATIESLLDEVGFSWDRLERYGAVPLAPGQLAYAATSCRR